MRNKSIGTKVSEEEYAALEKLAEARGLTLGEWLRELVLAELIAHTETALLFLQLIMRKLRRPVGGSKGVRCGMVVPNGVLFGDGICGRIKEELLKEFNLHTIRGAKGRYRPLRIPKSATVGLAC